MDRDRPRGTEHCSIISRANRGEKPSPRGPRHARLQALLQAVGPARHLFEQRQCRLGGIAATTSSGPRAWASARREPARRRAGWADLTGRRASIWVTKNGAPGGGNTASPTRPADRPAPRPRPATTARRRGARPRRVAKRPSVARSGCEGSAHRHDRCDEQRRELQPPRQVGSSSRLPSSGQSRSASTTTAGWRARSSSRRRATS